MDILRVLDVVMPILSAVGLVALTYGLGRIVLARVGPHAISRERDRNIALLLSFILLFANQLQHEPAPKWARLLVVITAVVYIAAAGSGRLRRTLFRSGGNESNGA